MKKIYAFIAVLFAAFSLSAGELTFYMGNRAIGNGAKVEFDDIEVEDFGDGLGMITMDPNLSLVSDFDTRTVKVTAECITGQFINLCAGGQCESGKKIVKEGVFLVAGQKLPLLFEYMDMMWDPSTPVPTDITTKISAVDTTDPETEISFIIVMNPSHSINNRDFEYTYEGQTLRYSVIDDGLKTCKTKDAEFLGAVSASKTANNHVWGDVIIPPKVVFEGKEYTVTEIGKGSFSGDFKSVTIPNTVTTIEWGAFSYCNGLTTVNLPSSVIKVEQSAFNACSNLRSVFINNPKTDLVPVDPYEHDYDQYYDPKFSFGRCENLRVIVCPKEFDETYLNLPTSIMVIHTDTPTAVSVLEDGTILDNYGKTLVSAGIPTEDNSYIIPDGVERITAKAINQYLTTITIPASVSYVEADAFIYGCGRVNFMDWPAWYENVTLENLESNPYRNGEAYAGGIKISTPELKEGMTEIKDYINMGLEGFRDEIEIPSTVKRIGAYAFYNNKELYHVFLNNVLEEIGDYAFSGCELLENQKFPATLKKIGDYAYTACYSLSEVNLPEGLSELGKGVFKNCGKIEKAVLVCDIDTLGDDLFANCPALNSIYLPLNLKSIGNRAFKDCPSLDSFSLPATLESIGEEAFYKTSLTKLKIPNSVSSIGNAAFAIAQLKELSIGSGVEEIPEDAFAYNLLVSVKFSEGLKKIGKNAFGYDMDANGIASVVLPSSVEEIGENAFIATPIMEMVIPDGVMTLPEGSCGNPSILTIGSGIKNIDANAFSFYKLITFRLKATMPPTLSDAFPITNDQNDQLTLVVNQGRKDRYTTNARWKQIDNIIEEETTDVTVYLNGTYTLAEEIRMQSGLMPSRVSKLKVVGPLSDADLRVIKENMVSLRRLDLSEVSNLTEIPDGQFKNSLLTEIVFPEGIKTINNDAFNTCRLLQLTELPETLTSIGKRAFNNCPGITISRIPQSMEVIGSRAFENCTGIREITVESHASIFSGVPGVFAACSLLERIDLSNTVLEEIGEEMFAGCHELDDILLPETVRGIGSGAFEGTAIRDISFLPESVEFIRSGKFDDLDEDSYKEPPTFGNCRRLVSATLPSKITHVDSKIFVNCPRLLTVSIPGSVESVGNNLVSGDKKLSNISCAAEVAPEAATGAFDNIRLRKVSLTIPALSFRSYLNAPQWGKFEIFNNSLRIPVKIDEGVDVSNVEEEDYQEMLREDELEAAQEEAALERDVENGDQLRRRAVRRAVARANTNSFAALFDGAQIPASQSSGTRVFINAKEGVTVTSVKFNGKEMISQLDGNSLVLPAGVAGELEIRTDATETGIEVISSDIDFDSVYDVYDLNGLLMGHDVDSLNAGIYIVRQGTAVKKISVK